MFESLFQSFTVTSQRAASPARIHALRTKLRELGMDGFIIPRADEHQNEYVPACAERLAWLTGFGGSAGIAIVLQDKAAIFVDGRYTLQVSEDVDTAIISPQAIAEVTPEAWIAGNIQSNQKLGFDPWLHTQAQVDRLEKAAEACGASLVALASNPIDAIWPDRPAPPHGRADIHKPKFAGEASADKLARIAASLGTCDALLVSDPHNLAWAFNLRGSDLAHTPLLLGYALIPRQGRATLFVQADKLSAPLKAALQAVADLASPNQLQVQLRELGKAGKRIRLDNATAASALVTQLRAAGGLADLGADPITLMKATKNPTEIAGTKAAHMRDGIAMARFLCWFDSAVSQGQLSEIEAAEALEHFRRETGKLKDISFPTISAADPNSAIPHYRVTEASNRLIDPGLFLIDSGGQYEDGTTDITRTIAVGRPSREMADRFTRVLQGHIAIASAVFPPGTSGAQLDVLARQYLWQAGLDFDHGTGHGVGSYLSVHEGPQRISKMGHVPLLPGMLISNEPGYYKAGGFGIRIENLILVTPVKIKGAERDMLGFTTISYAPIDLRLVVASRLNPSERAWLNRYHSAVYERLATHLDAREAKWLRRATRPI